MEVLVTVLQLLVALGLLNVWLVRFGKPSAWRGAGAASMRDEFAAYGLPPWFMWLVGFLKVTFAVLLIVGIWVPPLTRPVAIGVAILMLGAVLMHFNVRDPLPRSVPALTMLVLSLVVVAAA
jgi:uncharacterized membrane protein YphA (DoxX/SURF4 family)